MLSELREASAFGRPPRIRGRNEQFPPGRGRGRRESRVDTKKVIEKLEFNINISKELKEICM